MIVTETGRRRAVGLKQEVAAVQRRGGAGGTCLIKKESADKPGFVEGNHSSGIRVATYLKRPTRKPVWAIRAIPVRRLEPRASLFGLAPGGVCRATECYHRRGALLPHPFTLTASLRRFGGLLSVALSVDSRPPGVTWRLALGARTFLHACAQRLPGRLRRAWWGRDCVDASREEEWPQKGAKGA
jgi:hypothetical protein